MNSHEQRYLDELRTRIANLQKPKALDNKDNWSYIIALPFILLMYIVTDIIDKEVILWHYAFGMLFFTAFAVITLIGLNQKRLEIWEHYVKDKPQPYFSSEDIAKAAKLLDSIIMYTRRPQRSNFFPDQPTENELREQYGDVAFELLTLVVAYAPLSMSSRRWYRKINLQ